MFSSYGLFTLIERDRVVRGVSSSIILAVQAQNNVCEVAVGATLRVQNYNPTATSKRCTSVNAYFYSMIGLFS